MVSIKLIFFYSFFLPIKMCEYVSHGLDLKTPLNVHLTAFYKRYLLSLFINEKMFDCSVISGALPITL